MYLKVLDCLSSVQGPAKTEAAKCLPAYQLGLGENCKQHVESLMKDLKFHIIGSWGGVNGNVSNFWIHLSNFLIELGVATTAKECIQAPCIHSNHQGCLLLF